MEKNPKACAYALAGVFGIAYLACGLAYYAAPGPTMAFFDNIFHSSIQFGYRPFEAFRFAAGLVSSLASGLVLGWLFAVLYNKFASA